MVQSLKNMLSSQFEAFAADNGFDHEGPADQLDMLERGYAALYNPKLLTASQRLVHKQGFQENIIRREKSTMTYVMYEQIEKRRVHSGQKSTPKTQKAMLESSEEIMRARYKPQLKEFWLFNARVPVDLLDDEGNAFAKLYWNPQKKQFVLKNRHCTRCSRQSHYFCDKNASRAWPFQQELAYFSIKLARISEKIKLNFTDLLVGIPELDSQFQPLVWCPMMIKLKENNQFFANDPLHSGEESKLVTALNSGNYRDSLKEAYSGKSMSISQKIQRSLEQESDDLQRSDQLDGFNREDFKQIMDRYMAEGYRVSKENGRADHLTLERQDEIKLRGRRPQHDKYRQSSSLQFGGRVKMTSKKNCQVETKMKLDGRVKAALQHGKFNDEIFILDYGYPFSPVQAFAIALGIHNFRGNLDKSK